MPRKKPKVTICLDPSYLKQIAAFLESFVSADEDSHVVRLSIYDSDSAMRIDAYNGETDQGATFLVMPMRAEAEQFRNIYGAEALRNAHRHTSFTRATRRHDGSRNQM